jgi:hypothetical protein
MNRSIWIPVAVTVAVLGAAGLLVPLRPGGTAPASGAAQVSLPAAAASFGRAAAAAAGAARDRLETRAWFATRALAARGLPESPVPIEAVAWASMALATFAFARAAQLGRRGPAPHRRVARLAGRGLSSARIARGARLSQDAVRSLLQPAGAGSGRRGRNRLPSGRFRRPQAASGVTRDRAFNAMA